MASTGGAAALDEAAAEPERAKLAPVFASDARGSSGSGSGVSGSGSGSCTGSGRQPGRGDDFVRSGRGANLGRGDQRREQLLSALGHAEAAQWSTKGPPRAANPRSPLSNPAGQQAQARPKPSGPS